MTRHQQKSAELAEIEKAARIAASHGLFGSAQNLRLKAARLRREITAESAAEIEFL